MFSIAQIRKELEFHVQQKSENQKWLRYYLDDDVLKTSEVFKKFFPYTLPESSGGKLEKKFYKPQNQNTLFPNLKEGGERDPHYVMNIPCFADLDPRKTFEKVSDVVTLIRQQAFGETEEFSFQMLEKRLSLVIGMNRPESLDEMRNREFVRIIENEAPNIEGIPYRIIGFFWRPKWKIKEGMGKNTLSPQRAYHLVKVLRPRNADILRTGLEGEKGVNCDVKSQIPIRKIREQIFKSQETKDFFEHYFQGERESYLFTFDDDCLGLKNGGKGLLSVYDDMIASHIMEKKKIPELLTTGYQLKEQEYQILRFAVEMDRNIRAVIVKHIPRGVYYTEPNTLFRIQMALYRMGKYSFKGKGKELESRRFIQNAKDAGVLFDETTVICVSENPVTTETPVRMLTDKSQRLKTITDVTVREKDYLQTSRGVSQSHAFPKQWAENVYVGLPITVSKVRHATKALMNILNVFHPTSLIMEWKVVDGKYKATNYDEVMHFYNDYAESMKNIYFEPSKYADELATFESRAEGSEREVYSLFFKIRREILFENCRTLETFGLERGWMDKVVLAAFDTGLVIERFLSSL